MTSARSGNAGMESGAAAPPPAFSAASPTRARGLSMHALLPPCCTAAPQHEQHASLTQLGG